MIKLSNDRISNRVERTKAKVAKYLKVSFKLIVAAFVVAIITAIIYWLINKVIPIGPRETPTPTPSASPMPPPEPIGPVESTESAKDKLGRIPQDHECCWNILSGVYVANPPYIECMTYEFGKSMRDTDRMLSALSGAGVTLFGASGQREFNGFVSSRVGKESLSNYVVYLYSDNTINYEYDPPYVYRSTACTDELKGKMREKLDGIKATL